MEKHLKDIYFNLGEAGAFSGGTDVLMRAFRKKYPKSNISKKMVQNFLNHEVSYSLHRNARRNFKRNKIYVSGLNSQWCLDLADLGAYSKKNRGFRYILVVMDVFSRYAYAEPLKKKNSRETLAGFKKIVERSGATPTLLQSDMGTEFTNPLFQAYLKSKKIRFFISQGVKKNSICERAIRSIKERLHRYFDVTHDRKWVSILEQLIKSYNKSHHRSIGMAPENVNFYNSKEVYERLYGKRAKRERAKLKKGDYVRMSRLLRFTDKSFENRWTRALYKVARGPFYPQHGERPMYEIEEIDTNEKIPGTFYEDELLYVDKKTFFDDFIFPIEKRIRYRTKNGIREVYVKWLGYNSYGWVPLKSLTDIPK